MDRAARGTTEERPTFVRATLVLGLVALGAALFGLALQQSPTSVVLGRYSAKLAVTLAGLSAVWLFLAVATAWLWPRLLWLRTRGPRLPFALLPPACVAVGSLFIYIVARPRYGQLITPLFLFAELALAGAVLLGLTAFTAAPSSDELERGLELAAAATGAVFGLWLGGLVGWGLALGAALFAVGVWTWPGSLLWRAWAPIPTSTRAGVGWLGVALAGIALWWTWVYGLRLSSTLFDDELLHLTFAATHPPGASLFVRDYLEPIFFRPFYDVEAALFYRVFDLNFAGWHLGQALFLLLSMALLCVVLWRIGVAPFWAFLLSLTFAASAPVVIQLHWAIDTITVLTSLAVLGMLLWARPGAGLWWYAALGTLLILAPFHKETGLVVIAACGVTALQVELSGALSRRAMLSVWALCAAAALVYFVLRMRVVGLLSSTIGNSSGYLFSFVTGDELHALSGVPRMAYHLYTVAAHMVAPFFPFFSADGRLDLEYLHEAALLALPFGAVWWVWCRANGRWGNAPPGHLGPGLLLSALWLVPLAVSVYVAERVAGNPRAWMLVLIALISSGVLGALPFILGPRSPERSIAVYALALILVAAVVTFSYFQERNHYLPMVGWVTLTGLALTHLSATFGQRTLRVLVGLPVLMLVLTSSLVAHSDMTPVGGYALSPESTLCRSFFPAELAGRIAIQWGIDPAQLEQCRATGP